MVLESTISHKRTKVSLLLDEETENALLELQIRDMRKYRKSTKSDTICRAIRAAYQSELTQDSLEVAVESASKQ